MSYDFLPYTYFSVRHGIMLGSENSEFRVQCAQLTQSKVRGTPNLGKNLKIFFSAFYMNPPMGPFN